MKRPVRRVDEKNRRMVTQGRVSSTDIVTEVHTTIAEYKKGSIVEKKHDTNAHEEVGLCFRRL